MLIRLLSLSCMIVNDDCGYPIVFRQPSPINRIYLQGEKKLLKTDLRQVEENEPKLIHFNPFVDLINNYCH